MQVFAGGSSNIIFSLIVRNASLLLVCLINIIFEQTAILQRWALLLQTVFYTANIANPTQALKLWEPVSDFIWPHCVKRVHTVVQVWLWGCYLLFYTWHVAVAMTWQPSVSCLYSNPCLETLILDESHLLLLLSHQSHKICSFLVLNVYGILCLNILLIYFGKKLSLHRDTEKDNRFQAFLC